MSTNLVIPLCRLVEHRVGTPGFCLFESSILEVRPCSFPVDSVVSSLLFLSPAIVSLVVFSSLIASARLFSSWSLMYSLLLVSVIICHIFFSCCSVLVDKRFFCVFRFCCYALIGNIISFVAGSAICVGTLGCSWKWGLESPPLSLVSPRLSI